MSEKIISPGVFTRENDQSFLTTGIGQIGAVVIGPTEMGPAFIPTPITNANEYQAIFGNNSDKTYVPYTVKNYLKNAGIVTIVRVLGSEGWYDSFTRTQGQNDYIEIIADWSGSLTTVAILALTSGSITLPITFVSCSGVGSSFIISSSVGVVSCSLDKSSPDHILKVFGSDPYNRNGNGISREFYCYQLFEEYGNTLTASLSTISASLGNLTFETNAQYSPAISPWIQSQYIGGIPYNLFRFISLSDGTNVNKKYKIAIDNITKPTISGSYGTFNVVVRDFNDTDTRQSVLETFANCTLDPNSKNYVLRMIGDRYNTINSDGKVETFGEYENRSKYIRIEAADGLGSVPSSVVPFGHAAYYNPVITGSLGASVPPIKMVAQQGPTPDIYNPKYNWGIDLTYNDNKQFCIPLMDGYEAFPNVSGSFNLDNEFGHPYSTTIFGKNKTVSASLSSSDAPKEMLKFVVVLQGGWDGMPPNRAISAGASITATNVFGFDCSTATSAGTLAFKKAINTVSNPDEYDMNMLIIPGILQNAHPYILEHARNLCDERQDTFLIMDASGLNDSIADTIESVAGIDNNYVATYFPWVKIADSQRNKNVWVPPSVVLAGVIAFNDRVAASWYAPAGLNRGGLTDVIDVKKRLTHSDRDALYEGRVNPIAMFPGQGPSVWGQKTLQQKASALDRINVRRLLIELKKFFASTAKYIVFEPNTNQTRQQFLSIVNPYMDSVQRKSGIYAYKIVMDETNNTPDVIDRNILVGAVYIQPTRAAEFIELTFNILPTGAVFS